MLLRQIEYFQTVVEQNSFTAAADQCSISQSAISQQIQALEAELGVKLLERFKRRFTLTPAGELFHKRSVLITADLEQLRRDTLRVGRAGAKELNVEVLISYSGEEFTHAIHKRKIDMADEIFVINVGGYIGSSTRAEIEYATTHGKPVHYLEK